MVLATLDKAAALGLATATPLTDLRQYILVGGLKVTYSYQVLKNGLEDVTNDVRDCPGGDPCYVLVYVGLEAGLVTQSKDSLFCPQQKWTFHLFLHFDSADF